MPVKYASSVAEAQNPLVWVSPLLAMPKDFKSRAFTFFICNKVLFFSAVPEQAHQLTLLVENRENKMASSLSADPPTEPAPMAKDGKEATPVRFEIRKWNAVCMYVIFLSQQGLPLVPYLAPPSTL